MASSRSTTQIISQILETVYGHDGDDDESITQTKTTYAVHLNNQLNYGIQNFMKKQQDKEDAPDVCRFIHCCHHQNDKT